MTRKLSELHINAVIDAINSNTIERVFINPAKKPKGAFNITYNVIDQSTVGHAIKGKTSVKIQLMRAMQEIKSALKDNRLHSVALEYDATTDKFSYQLIQR